MATSVRIGNAHGFWGDRIEAAAEMLRAEPELDFLTLDFLAEVSMSIMAAQQKHDPQAGYARDFIDVLQTLTPYWQTGGQCRVVTNAGGLNPLGCALACQQILHQQGCSERSIAVVTGDDVTSWLRDGTHDSAQLSNHLDTGQAVEEMLDAMLTANAYLGAAPVVEALTLGADLVITGRVADPSLTVGPCIYHFGWSPSDYDQIAGATVAGHLIECGTQVTGGISTDWLTVPNAQRIGFPIVEVNEDGSCLVSKPADSGGHVTESTVKEQLLYEIGDPEHYLSPDVAVSFSSVQLAQAEPDRVRVWGAVGRPPSDTLKVSATYQRGHWAAGQLTIYGHQAAMKARRSGHAILDGLDDLGLTFEHQLVELIGEHPTGSEVVLRVAVADPSREAVQQFSRSVMPLITAGPPGTTGYAEGRPKIHPWIGYWPCLIRRDQVQSKVQLLPPIQDSAPAVDDRLRSRSVPVAASANRDYEFVSQEPTGTLADIALARSGDKGMNANVGVIARAKEQFPRLRALLTPQLVAQHFELSDDRVRRYELPNLSALNFVLLGVLANPLRNDAQGKSLGQQMLQIPLSPRPGD